MAGRRPSLISKIASTKKLWPQLTTVMLGDYQLNCRGFFGGSQKLGCRDLTQFLHQSEQKPLLPMLLQSIQK